MLLWSVFVLIGASAVLVFIIDKRAQRQGGQSNMQTNLVLILMAVMLVYALLYAIRG
ncbi:hypothetical protein [Spirosoma harenae]